jgi:hypothetical protein
MRAKLILAFLVLAGCAQTPAPLFSTVKEPPLAFPDGGAILQVATVQNIRDRWMYRYDVSLPLVTLRLNHEQLVGSVYRPDARVRDAQDAADAARLVFGASVSPSSYQPITNRLGIAYLAVIRSGTSICVHFSESIGENEFLGGTGCRPDQPGALDQITRDARAFVAGIRLRA